MIPEDAKNILIYICNIHRRNQGLIPESAIKNLRKENTGTTDIFKML